MLKKKLWPLSIVIFSVWIPLCAYADSSFVSMEECLQHSLQTADDEMSVGEIKQYCLKYFPTENDTNEPSEDISDSIDETEADTSIIDTRLDEEKITGDAEYILTPHRANYLIPAAFNSSPNHSVYGGALDKDQLDNVEVKFQLSIKYRVFDDLFKDNGDFYFAYTSLSYWQAYNMDLSSPFRDTCHEPELWLQFDTDYEWLGIKANLFQLGVIHQSNGRSEPLSRSWNRVFANFVFAKNNFIFGIKPWWRIPENEDEDNNPKIVDYMGHGEIHAAYKWHDHTLTMMLRNNFKDGDENKGALQLAWSFPLYKKLKGYFQYFCGYGQTILDYDDAADTVGFGIALSDVI
ncbi:MAG: phospholipase A [Desulfobacteraceae bacterium]|jgi:phospholipase A1